MRNFEPLCFMRTDGLYVSDETKERLYATAHEMAQTQERRRTFQMPDGSGEGEITTRYRTSNMGDIGGDPVRRDPRDRSTTIRRRLRRKPAPTPRGRTRVLDHRLLCSSRR